MGNFKLIRTIDDNDLPIIVSFSAGETSADMLLRIWRKYFGKRKIIVLFANTGQEDDKSLDFVHKIELFYRIDVIWLEAVINPVYNKGITHRVVSYETAKRYNDLDTPMELLIDKLGIPNKDHMHCTRDLKTRVIEHYLKYNGIKKYNMCVGIRSDEPTRLTRSDIFYEPAMMGMTKKKVNKSWRDRPFRLKVTGLQGNCRWCHKKTLRKLLTIAVKTPEVFDFPERMEQKYENYINPVKKKKLEDKGKIVHLPIRFYRENRSVADIKQMAKGFTDFYHDENQVYDEELDSHEGDCSDHCEPFK